MLLAGDSIDYTDLDMWDKSGLTDYLSYDTWQPHNAWRVIGGLHYHAPASRDYVYHTSSGLGYAQSLSEGHIERLTELWARDAKDPNENGTPEFFIDFAIDRRIYPPWLGWALKRGWYKLKYGKNTKKPDFDKESPTYPPELDIAIQAWRELSKAEDNRKPKARILAWLDANPKVWTAAGIKPSDQAKERIATVANWDKTGGPTRSGK